MEQTPRKSNFLKWSLIIGIVIVLNLFFTYALSLVYTVPSFDDFCGNAQAAIVDTQQSCLKVGGQWTQTATPQAMVSPGTVPSRAPDVNGYCNPTFTCQKNFDAVNKIYDRNVFVVLVVLGIVSIVFGIFLKIPDAVTIGLSLGGVLALIIASVRYWSEAESILKVIILAVALIALIWVGIKKFSEQ